MDTSLQNILGYIPPIDTLKIPNCSPNIFLVREDLGPLGGGNKVRRLCGWIGNKNQFKNLKLLSDSGSHSHLGLYRIFEAKIFPWLQSITLYERPTELNPYVSHIKNQMQPIPNLKVEPLTSIFQWKKYLFAKGLDSKKIPIGASVKCNGIYENILTQKNFSNLDEEKTILSMPIGSGNSFFEILNLAQNLFRNFEYLCPVTATVPRIWSKIKYTHTPKNVKLYYPAKLSWKEYMQKAKRFYDSSGVVLDPIHTIYLLDVIENRKFYKGNIVLWISCPRINGTLLW